MSLDVATHPEFAANGSFAHLKLGRSAKREDSRTLQLAKYLDDAVALPETPPTCDYASAVPSWPIYGNDRLGDCTCASAGLVISTVLLFGRYVRAAASAVARYGLVGCWHRLLHGDGSQP